MIDALPLLLGPEGYQISRSVRLRSSASAYFSRTPASATNTGTFTWSGWVKRGTLGAGQFLFGCTITEGNNYTYLNFSASNNVNFGHVFAGANQWFLSTSQLFRDPSAWYHIVAVADTGNATVADRVRLYVNGVQITAFSSSLNASLNAGSYINSTNLHAIGRYGSSQYLDGYLTEINFIDGLTPNTTTRTVGGVTQTVLTELGEFDAVTGVWKPVRWTRSFGTNGFYLNFSDNSAATAAAIGKDYSGNGNNWTPNNISVTAGATYDSMLDVPTPWPDGGNGRGNYAVLNPLNTTGGALSAANLNYVNTSATTYFSVAATMALKGKIYWEVTVPDSTTPLPGIVGNGILPATGGADANTLGGIANGYGLRYTKTEFRNNNTTIASGLTSYSDGAVLAFAYDSDTGKLWYAVNNTWQASGDPAAGTNPIATTSTTIDFFPAIAALDSGSANFNFGQRPFAYTPPSGFKALNTQNLPTPTILKGNQYFDVTTYTGNGSTQSIVNSGGMQPDLVWLKSRSAVDGNNVFDSVRGATQRIITNATNAEDTTSGVTAFNSNGFNLGSVTSNVNASTYVGWQWKEGATQGFDIVTYTGNSTNRTIAHSLGVAPSMMIVKNRTGGTSNWRVWHSALAGTEFLELNTTAAKATGATQWNSTVPTSTVFSLGTATATNGNGDLLVNYLFSEVAGFSKFGSYTGNGSADGPFVFCGFRLRWVIIKRTDTTSNWTIFDSSRDPSNVSGAVLFPNLSDAEGSLSNMDILSNGFKFRGTGSNYNASGGTYIYAAFAENPFKNALAR